MINFKNSYTDLRVSNLNGNCGVILAYDFPYGGNLPYNIAKEIEEFLQACVDFGKRESMSMVMATTTTDQPHSEEILANFGFDCSQPMVRYPHIPNRNTKVWWFPIRGYEET